MPPPSIVALPFLVCEVLEPILGPCALWASTLLTSQPPKLQVLEGSCPQRTGGISLDQEVPAEINV